MQKSSRKTTRFPLNFHAMPMDKGLHKGGARKSVKWELANEGLYPLEVETMVSYFVESRPSPSS